MNYCVISGKICSDLTIDLNKTNNVCKFTIKNLYYDSNKSVQVPTLVRCLAYGTLADYVYNEMYAGCEVLVTGRIIFKRYLVNNQNFDKMYVACTTVSKLEQEEYN